MPDWTKLGSVQCDELFEISKTDRKAIRVKTEIKRDCQHPDTSNLRPAGNTYVFPFTDGEAGRMRDFFLLLFVLGAYWRKVEGVIRDSAALTGSCVCVLASVATSLYHCTILPLYHGLEPGGSPPEAIDSRGQ